MHISRPPAGVTQRTRLGSTAVKLPRSKPPRMLCPPVSGTPGEFLMVTDVIVSEVRGVIGAGDAEEAEVND